MCIRDSSKNYITFGITAKLMYQLVKSDVYLYINYDKHTIVVTYDTNTWFTNLQEILPLQTFTSYNIVRINFKV